tara:strand:+ start:337 stop:495 length:159 start_codon:yes stop_codon:yes gene_type:complete
MPEDFIGIVLGKGVHPYGCIGGFNPYVEVCWVDGGKKQSYDSRDLEIISEAR